jgi:acyl-CoA reductase-like NAD-dependent aldehyde dehydrogenase
MVSTTRELQHREDFAMPLIEGRSIASASDRNVDVINPSSGRRCLSIPAGADADVDRAVASARRAFAEARWSGVPPSLKKATLHRLADLIATDANALDVLDAVEMGKPVREAFAGAKAAAQLMRFYAEAVDKVAGDLYASDTSSVVAQRRVPRGVVAAVVPWNFPTYAAVLKLAPALAAGNSVVLKPSELSSRSAIRLAQLALEAGLAPGVLNVVPGLGETVGAALGLHRDVDMITFTGSTVIGKRMLQYSAQSNMKVVLAECGGKSPHIVFADCSDLHGAAETIGRMILTNQGQICSVGSRVLVERDIESKLLELIATRLRQIVMGDALDPQTTFGPLASARQCARVMEYVETAQTEGAERVTGGRRVLEHTGGYFVEPTIFRNVPPAARLAQEEIFGPVLSITAFDHEAEAIRLANGTAFGLAAYAWTSDLSRAMRLMKTVRSSIRIHAAAAIGEGAGHAAAHEPFGESGVGTEGGLAGMESYLHRQRVWITHT